MADAVEQQMSHADRHDLDKLARWKSGLDAAEETGESSLPVCAIFLVSPEDRLSHDIFRRYRSAFEELGGGFHHLVIFGQHGVSTTQRAFLNEAGWDQGNVPLLAIAQMHGTGGTVHSIELPKGDRNGDLDDSQTWGTALASLAQTATGNGALDLDQVDGVRRSAFRRGSLVDTVNCVTADLGGHD
jgi:hypothetical protein